MNSLIQFWKNADKAFDFVTRSATAFVIKENLIKLKNRHESGDKNVVPYINCSGHIERYGIELTPEQRKELEIAYHKAAEGRIPSDDDRIELFVGIIESWGSAMPRLLAIDNPTHKARHRSIDSFIAGVEKIDCALAEMDSSALGWLYANVTDKLALQGVQVSPDDSELVSMRAHRIQAQLEAAELRTILRGLARVVVDAAADTKETLPLIERGDNDPRMTTAKALERLIIEDGLEFSTAESGFPAQCLRAVFELGGLEVEKVSYWLKKAADDPDSYAKFQQRMQEKIEGKNLPRL